MVPLSQDQLRQRLADGATRVKPGFVYRHYKGDLYLVTSLAIIEATNEVGVIYQAQYGQRLTYIRPLSVWLEIVEHAGEQVPRFTPAA